MWSELGKGQIMSNLLRFARGPLAWVAVLSASLSVTGCGVETTPPKLLTNPQPTEAASSEKSSQVKGKASDGDMTAQERRAARKKAN